jgi:FixJ family two-component response regulator
LRKKIIAVVDDDESIREAVEGLVRSLGHEALTFVSAEAFLAFSGIGSIACLVTDLQMPGLSGIDLRNRLVALDEPIPTILITAYPEERTRRLASKAGVLCYLTKPFSDNELIECLQQAFLLETKT